MLSRPLALGGTSLVSSARITNLFCEACENNDKVSMVLRAVVVTDTYRRSS